jgi:hypothetical protein
MDKQGLQLDKPSFFEDSQRVGLGGGMYGGSLRDPWADKFRSPRRLGTKWQKVPSGNGNIGRR